MRTVRPEARQAKSFIGKSAAFGFRSTSAGKELLQWGFSRRRVETHGPDEPSRGKVLRRVLGGTRHAKLREELTGGKQKAYRHRFRPVDFSESSRRASNGLDSPKKSAPA
jgi:hypothetical protein